MRTWSPKPRSTIIANTAAALRPGSFALENRQRPFSHVLRDKLGQLSLRKPCHRPKYRRGLHGTGPVKQKNSGKDTVILSASAEYCSICVSTHHFHLSSLRENLQSDRGALLSVGILMLVYQAQRTGQLASRRRHAWRPPRAVPGAFCREAWRPPPTIPGASST